MCTICYPRPTTHSPTLHPPPPPPFCTKIILLLTLQQAVFLNFYGAQESIPGNWSASLCSLAGWYDNPIPTQFLAPIGCSKIPAQDYRALCICICKINSMHICLSVFIGTPTKHQVSKRPVSKRQVYKTSGLQNVRFQNVWFQNGSGFHFGRLILKIYLGYCSKLLYWEERQLVIEVVKKL